MHSDQEEVRRVVEMKIARALCQLNYLDGGVIADDGWDGCPEDLKQEHLADASRVLEWRKLSGLRADGLFAMGGDYFDGSELVFLTREKALAEAAKRGRSKADVVTLKQRVEEAQRFAAQEAQDEG